MYRLVLGAAALVLSAGAASAQSVYPSYGYAPYGLGYAGYGYGAPLYDYAGRSSSHGRNDCHYSDARFGLCQLHQWHPDIITTHRATREDTAGVATGAGVRVGGRRTQACEGRPLFQPPIAAVFRGGAGAPHGVITASMTTSIIGSAIAISSRSALVVPSMITHMTPAGLGSRPALAGSGFMFAAIPIDSLIGSASVRE
jgi:hypothetical protein